MSSPFDAAVKKLLLSNLLFYFRVRIGPEALQLAAVVTLYFPGLMQARRLRLNRRRRQHQVQLYARNKQYVVAKLGSVFAGLSQADSSLVGDVGMSLPSRAGRNNIVISRGSRFATRARNRPGDSLLTFSFPGIWSYSCGQPFDLFFPGLWTRWSHWSC